MRVIAGKYKRSNLNTLDGDLTRPTKDMVKEALFSSIVINENTVFLDLFSGSGSIGIEALSRGAKDVVFNDINKDAVMIIRSNLNKFNENKMVYNLSYKECLNQISIQFDYIYLDPPYSFTNYDEIFQIILDKKLLKDSGIIIVEVRKNVNLNNIIMNMELFKEKKYGITKLLYYKKGD